MARNYQFINSNNKAFSTKYSYAWHRELHRSRNWWECRRRQKWVFMRKAHLIQIKIDFHSLFGIHSSSLRFFAKCNVSVSAKSRKAKERRAGRADQIHFIAANRTINLLHISSICNGNHHYHRFRCNGPPKLHSIHTDVGQQKDVEWLCAAQRHAVCDCGSAIDRLIHWAAPAYRVTDGIFASRAWH